MDAVTDKITISVVYAQPYEQRVIFATVAAGTTVCEAIKRTHIERFFVDETLVDMTIAIFGKTVKNPAEEEVYEGCRIELCGALIKQGMKHK